MDEICIMFAPNIWRSMPYVYQIFVSNMCPVPMRNMVILASTLVDFCYNIIRFQKKHTTVQVHKLHVVPFNESSN